MMRWEPTGVNVVREDIGAVHTDAAPAGTSPVGDVTTLRYLLDAAVASMSSLGARAVVVLVMALVVAALVFGLSADDVAAGVRYCPSCK